jgi:hypothetical protein
MSYEVCDQLSAQKRSVTDRGEPPEKIRCDSGKL